MKNLLHLILFMFFSFSATANVVLTVAGNSAIQSGVPFSVDMTFSNLPTTCAISYVRIDYSLTVTPSCVLPSSVKTIGGTYWGSGIGSNPPLVNTLVNGSTLPISSNMLPIFSGLSANAILNFVTENGKFANGSVITIQATANYFSNSSATTPCATEIATPVSVTVIALDNFTAAINTTCATAVMNGYQIYNLTIIGGAALGSSNLYGNTQNLTFYQAPCLSVYNVYSENWLPVPYSTGPAGIVKLSTGNLSVTDYKIYRVVLHYPCPGTAPCVAGNNMATSFHVSGTDVCGNYMAFASPINNCIITGACGSGPSGIPVPGLSTGLVNSSSILCPGACNLLNYIEIDNQTVFSYPNSTIDYTMPNTTNLNYIQFDPPLPSATSMSISYSGVGCPSVPYGTVLSGSSLSVFSPPSSINNTAPSCSTKIIHVALPAPMINPFSVQKVYFEYNVSNSAPSSGLASFPFVFGSSVLGSVSTVPFNIPYVNSSPSIYTDSKLISGGNCVSSEYYNPGQLVTYSLIVEMTNPTPITNMVLTDMLNSNILIDPSSGIKLFDGLTNICTGLPYVNAAFNQVGTNFTTMPVSVSGNIITASINTSANQLTLTCPNLAGAPSCSSPRYLIIEFKAKIKPGTMVGPYANTFQVNGSNITTVYSGSAFAIVNSYYELSLRMKVKRDNGIFVNQLTTCLCQASPNPNANKISYRGELINTGNVTVKDISFFNMKPKGGDLSFQSCTSSARGTSGVVNGISSYNHPFNSINSMYSLVPLNFSNTYNSGFLYSAGPIPMNSIDARYYNNANPLFNAPQLQLCSPCATCLPFTSITTPVHFGSAMYTIHGVSGSSGVNLNGGESITFITNPVCIQNVPSGTQLVNDFYIQGTRADLNILTPVIKSNSAVVTVNATGCSANGCDTSILKWAPDVEDYRRYYFRIGNQSGAPVHKIKIDLLPIGCFSTSYSYTLYLNNPLLPGSYINIQNSTALFPNLPYPCTCAVGYKVRLYTLTSSGVPLTYDSCSRVSNWIQMPSLMKQAGIQSDETVSVYPIPARDFLNVNISGHFDEAGKQSTTFDFLIFDLSGKMVLKQTCYAREAEISLASLAQGLYFFKIIIDNEVIRYDKFVKD